MLDKRTRRKRQKLGSGSLLARRWHRSSHFDKLPTELVFEIATDVNNSGDTFAVADLSQNRDTDGSNGSRDEDIRQSTLRALSQTSRKLRAICLPLLWERVILPYEHPYDFRNEVDSDGNQFLLSRFDRIMGGLAENPTLAAYVRRLDVFFQPRRDWPWRIARLTDCRFILSGLHTLRVDGSFPYACFDFPLNSFPQVRTLIIPVRFTLVLVLSCPNVRAVICQATAKRQSSEWLLNAFDYCGDTLEIIDGFPIDPETAQYLAETTHNLRVIKFSDWVSPDSLILLKSLRRLHTIEMDVTTHRHKRGRKPKSAKQLDSWMVTAREVLAGHYGCHGQRHGGKRVKMRYCFIDHIDIQHPTIHETLLDVKVD